jgi:CBS domain-containing protein
MTVHIADPVGSVAGREPVFVDADATLRAVARTLWSESVGIAVVGDERHPLGVISERDVVTELAQGADPDTRTARSAMTAYLITARREDPIYDAAGQMLDDIIRHLPVVDEDGRVIGMVSVRDLIRPLLLDALTARVPRD